MMENIKYLRLEEQYPHDWAFNRPDQWEFFDRKLERAELLEQEGEPEKAIQACLEIIEACPEYLPAVNKLGILYRDQGGLETAINVFESAVGVGLACLPQNFQPDVDLIPWHWQDNRAFLLAIEHLAACHLESALNFYEYALKVNPGYRSIDKLVEQLHDICKSRGIVE